MSDTTAPGGKSRFESPAVANSHFAWLRTRMSTERTLMSWMRTATALIGFGFTIVQFFERFSHFQGVSAAVAPVAPRWLGLALIGAGVIGLSIGLWEYRTLLRHLWGSSFSAIAGLHERPTQTPLPLVAILIVLIGIFAFAAILLRI